MGRSVLCGPGKSIAEVLNEPFLWELPEASNVWAELLECRATSCPIDQPEETTKWVRGTYELAKLFVRHPLESSLQRVAEGTSNWSSQRPRASEMAASAALYQPGIVCVQHWPPPPPPPPSPPPPPPPPSG